MPVYLDTRGYPSIAIAICARCKVKYPYSDLTPDPNFPGLRVCPDGCKDQLDPWRLPARPDDQITLDQPRPDLALTIGSQLEPIDPLHNTPPASPLQVSVVWTPNTPYIVGSQVTRTNPYGQQTVGLLYQVYTCIVAGTSGVIAPNWPSSQGIEFSDGSVRWIDNGLFLH